MSDDIYRGIIKYSSRDFDSVLADYKLLVEKMTDLWKPESPADPGAVLLHVLASANDSLSTNLDWLANEIFAPSVSQRKNAEKLFGLIGYTLSWYTAARTEVTFTNNSGLPIDLDFGFNGNNFCTLNAYTDITQQPRVITYNVLPMTNILGAKDSRGSRNTLTNLDNVFVDTDRVHLEDGVSVTRLAIEGELRSYTVSVQQVKDNRYIIKLPSQHIDTSAVWIKARSSLSDNPFLPTQWIQVASASEFVTPEPRFAVTYDNYSNAQVQISNYLNQLENYDSNYLTIFWIDCSGLIGSVNSNVLSNFLPAKPDANVFEAESLTISNLSNTVELPHTYTVTGKSPETAKEAYVNSRNYINTNDSLITLPDFNRFLNREPGVDCGYVLDCQKAVEINLAIYNDTNLTNSQKSKMYITHQDFPASGDNIFDWAQVLDLGFDPTDPTKFVFAANFKRYTAMCFAVHNDFKNSNFGEGKLSNVQIKTGRKFIQYKPPQLFIDNVKADYAPLQAMTVQVDFGFARIFPWYVVGEIFPTHPVSNSVAQNLILRVKEALALYFAPANRRFGQKPTYAEIIEVAENADSRIAHFDLGSPGSRNYGVVWNNVDIECFNPISYARYQDYAEINPKSNNIRVNPEWIIS